MENKYIKLSDLIGQNITIKSIKGTIWKKWDAQNKKMLVSKEYQPYNEGWNMKYQVETDKGIIDFSPTQLGSMLTRVLTGTSAELKDKVFKVSSNGKVGKEVRYYFSIPKPNEITATEAKELPEIDMDFPIEAIG